MRAWVLLGVLALVACTGATVPPNTGPGGQGGAFGLPVATYPTPPPRPPSETWEERKLRENLFAALHAGACGAMPRDQAISLAARIGAHAQVYGGMPKARVNSLASTAMDAAFADRECSEIAVAQARALARDYPPTAPAARPAPRPAIAPADKADTTGRAPKPKPGEIDL